jgi:ribosomal protein S27AE
MKTIANIGAAILIFFGVLFIWGAFSTQSQNQIGSLVTGVITVGIGLVIVWFANRKVAAPGEQKVTYDVNLSGDVQLEKFECENCGGSLSSKNVKMMAGAPMVECPYCGKVYQLAEKPKW